MEPMQHNRRKLRAGDTAHVPATGAVLSRDMALMSASAASGWAVKPASYASGLTASGTLSNECELKVGCAKFKIEKPAPAAASRKAG